MENGVSGDCERFSGQEKEVSREKKADKGWETTREREALEKAEIWKREEHLYSNKLKDLQMTPLILLASFSNNVHVNK